MEHWSQVLFSDESKFEIFQEKRRKFVRRLANERMIDQCIIPTVKHGGSSVMVWSCFAGDKVDDFVKIEATMKKRRLPCHFAKTRNTESKAINRSRIHFPTR